MNRIVIAFCLNLLFTSAAPFAFARNAATAVPIIGCYSDRRLIENEGMVTGSGSFTIRKVDGRYHATFVELMHDGGEYYPEVTIENLIVNTAKRMIKFDIALHDGKDVTVLRGVTGKVSRAGIRMNWRGHAGHGQASPFMRREYCRL